MSLAIFDLDNTLIGGDSDHLWGEFLVEQNLVDSEEHKQSNDQFYEDYCRGELNIQAYLEFALGPLAQFSAKQLEKLHTHFMKDKIKPIMLPKAQALIKKHQQEGDTLLIITATNRFVTQPIARALGIDMLLASEGEQIDGRYTGKPIDIPCYGSGKVERFQRWNKERQFALSESFFYSDSHNDLPLLQKVGHPVAVNPDDKLQYFAEQAHWPIVNLRE